MHTSAGSLLDEVITIASLFLYFFVDLGGVIVKLPKQIKIDPEFHPKRISLLRRLISELPVSLRIDPRRRFERPQ